MRQLVTLIPHPGSREGSVHGASFACSFNQSEPLAMGWFHPIQGDLPLPFLESFLYTHPDKHFYGDSTFCQVGSEV